MARMRRVILAGEHEDAHPGRMREQIRNQLETLVRRVRRGRQAQVHQRELRRLWQLAQQFDRVRPRFAGQHLELRAERERQGLHDQDIVVDDKKPGPAFRR